MKVLVVDVGGTSIKVGATGHRTRVRIPSGRSMTPQRMVRLVREATSGLTYDAVSIGYPGRVHGGRPAREPHNLGRGWTRFSFETAFERPVRVINDAAMQALGSYKRGRMLFLGLGTGLGSALVVDGVVAPLELAHLPYRKRHFRGIRRQGGAEAPRQEPLAAARVQSDAAARRGARRRRDRTRRRQRAAAAPPAGRRRRRTGRQRDRRRAPRARHLPYRARRRLDAAGPLPASRRRALSIVRAVDRARHLLERRAQRGAGACRQQLRHGVRHAAEPLSVDWRHVHRIEGEIDPSTAAGRYETTIRAAFRHDSGVPRFDLLLLGLGTDAHTASLFPATRALVERDALVAANRVAGLRTTRITMTLPLLNAARRVMFLVTGADKAPAVRQVLESIGGTATAPAARVQPRDGRVDWILDAAAASLIGTSGSKAPDPQSTVMA